MATLPQPNENLVKVFDTEQESEALVVKGLLESEGIDSVMSSLDNPQDLIPTGGVILQVREEQAEEARRVISENYNPSPDDEELTVEEPSQPE